MARKKKTEIIEQEVQEVKVEEVKEEVKEEKTAKKLGKVCNPIVAN